MSTFDTLMSAGTHAMASVRDDSKGDRQVVQTAETHNTQHSVLPIRVVLPRGQKETVLYTVAVCSTDTGETVMKKLRAKNQEHCSQFSATFEPFLRALVMQSIAVHVATVSPVSTPFTPQLRSRARQLTQSPSPMSSSRHIHSEYSSKPKSTARS